MRGQSQVSVMLSTSTKERLDLFTERLGMKKNFVVEQAILFFMQSRRDLPDEAFIPTRIVLGDEGFEEFVQMIESDDQPTQALVELMNEP